MSTDPLQKTFQIIIFTSLYHHSSICHLQTRLPLVFSGIFIDVIFIFYIFRFVLVLSVRTDEQGRKTQF